MTSTYHDGCEERGVRIQEEDIRKEGRLREGRSLQGSRVVVHHVDGCP